MIESGFGRGTVFSLDVDGREYWITAKHILNGAQDVFHTGSIAGKFARVKILDQGVDEERWLAVDFAVIDPGVDLDVVVLAPDHNLLVKPIQSVEPSRVGIMMGGECEFLGFPYGGGWHTKLDGQPLWLPFVKHCTVSTLPLPPDSRIWILDGINNAGFSGGPVLYGTGPQQKLFAVISGYRTEPADVIRSPQERITRPKPPEAPKSKGSQAEAGAGAAKETVNVNSGFIIAFDIGCALDAIKKNPIGPLRK